MAFIEDGNVFNFTGKYLGRFESGFFWDLRGGAAAFVEDAEGGPVLPIPEVSPVPPIPNVPPVPAIPEITPIPPINRLEWGVPWQSFLLGRY